MGVFYSMSGVVVCRNVPKVEEIVDRFNSEAGEINIEMEVYGTDECTLIFSGGQFMSYDSVTKLDEIAQELGPYTIEPGLINTKWDSEDNVLYIGPPDGEADTISANNLEVIKGLVGSLTADDLSKLAHYLLDAHSHTKEGA